MAKAGKGNKAFTCIVPEDTYECLKQWAETKEWSVSQAARKLIETGLDRELGIEPEPPPELPKKPKRASSSKP